MAQQQPSMILSMLKTPQQVRQEQLAKLREKSLAQASLLAQPVAGAQTALPGLLRNYAAGIAAEIPTDIAQATRGITRGVGGMLGAAGYGEAGKAIAGATVTPEERLAATRQRMLRGQDTTDSTKLMQIAKQLSAAGDQQGAQILTQQAMQLDSAAAQRALVQAQAEQASAKAKEATASAEKTAEQTRRLKEFFPLDKISKENANRAQLSGIRLDSAKIRQISDNITTEEVKRRATEQQITESEARVKMVNEELDRYIAMTPSEVLKSQLEAAQAGANIALTGSQITLNQARMGDIDQTDFLRELEQLDATDEEKQQLIESRVKALATPEGITGAQSKLVDAKLGILNNAIETAIGSSTTINQIEQALPLLDKANLGRFSEPKIFINKILGDVFGIQNAQETTLANELIGVLNKRITLDEASALKGALSERDLQFLIDASPGNVKSAATVQQLFANLYTQRFSENFAAKQLEKEMSNLAPGALNKYEAGDSYDELLELGRYRAQQKLGIIAEQLQGAQ